jgi:hypothetical protein
VHAAATPRVWSRGQRAQRGRCTVAREVQPQYLGGDLGTAAEPRELAALEQLEAAVERLSGLDADPLSESEVRAVLVRAQRAVDRLLGLRSKLAGTLESRALREAGPGRESQALRQVRDRTSDELRLTPSETKRAGETGRRLAEVPAAERAMTAGELPPDHARVLADTLQHLSGADRERAEHELLGHARREDARAFGRRCRRLLAQLDGEAAQLAQDRRNARRHLRVTDTPDGMLAFHGQGSGWDAEVVATTLHAFGRPGADDRRTAEQRAWDALVSVCRVALDAGVAPENRGVRPHVLVVVEHPAVGQQPDLVDATWTGPLPWTEVRRHLVDAGLSRLLVDAKRVPLEASEGVRSVPAGLWKVLQVRDPSCVAVGCSVPAGWCQVMHLDGPYHLGGRLSPRNAALGCVRHHRLYDRGAWVVSWVAGRPVLHHPDRAPPEVDAPARAGP